MAFTKEQRLLVLMAIACMGLAVVSAGCVDNARAILKPENKTTGLMDKWCDCVNKTRNNPAVENFTNYCFDHLVIVEDFYNISVSSVNCSTETEFKELINPYDFCEGFNASATPPTTTTTKTTTTTTTTTPSPNTTIIISSTTPTTNGTITISPTPTTNETEPTPSTTPNPTTITTSEPETSPTYLAWLIPLILLLVAAMFGLGCYLHRRTKGSRGFHHSTKTNGSTKATNGEA